jgi:polyribonucleotide nucleotidyltransferase
VPESVSLEIGGRPLVIETGELAKQANGAALVRYGDQIVVLCAATASEKPREGIDFFPLTCDYEEKMYAAGKIPGGYIKREGRPSEHAILSARQIDRPIRPLFPDGFRNDVQIIATVLSTDPGLDSDTLAVVAAGAALGVSDIPFQKNVAAVRVGRDENGKYIANPTLEQYETGGMEIVVAGTADAVMMVEGGAKEISEKSFSARSSSRTARSRRSSKRSISWRRKPANRSAIFRSSRTTKSSRSGCARTSRRKSRRRCASSRSRRATRRSTRSRVTPRSRSSRRRTMRTSAP